MSASVQVIENPLPKVSHQVIINRDDAGFKHFLKKYEDIKKSAMLFPDPFNEELFGQTDTIGALIRDKVLQPHTFKNLEEFLDAFYIVNNSDLETFSVDDKILLQTYFNSLGDSKEFTQVFKYIDVNGIEDENKLIAFIILYQKYIARRMVGKKGGKRRKSISRTRGPSKHKRRRSSSKRTKRHTRRRRHY